MLRLWVQHGSLGLEWRWPEGSACVLLLTESVPSVHVTRKWAHMLSRELASFLFHSTSLSCSKTTGCGCTKSSRERSDLFSVPLTPQNINPTMEKHLLSFPKLYCECQCAKSRVGFPGWKQAFSFSTACPDGLVGQRDCHWGQLAGVLVRRPSQLNGQVSLCCVDYGWLAGQLAYHQGNRISHLVDQWALLCSLAREHNKFIFKLYSLPQALGLENIYYCSKLNRRPTY